MPRFKFAALIVALLTLGAATVALAQGGDDHRRDGKDRARNGDRWHRWDRDGRNGNRFAVARLINAQGDTVGRAWLKQRRRGRGVAIFARVRDLPPGFHGFHIHTIGRCDRPTFGAAGGHFNPTGAGHGDHAGDLPSLLVNRDGSALLMAVTDRFRLRDLFDRDGSAVMVHAARDNFANIPARYGGPDAETLSTGDAGPRLACGVVR